MNEEEDETTLLRAEIARLRKESNHILWLSHLSLLNFKIDECLRRLKALGASEDDVIAK